jgi:leader peptidase (prepilin peptidase)/N-methyltransferase
MTTGTRNGDTARRQRRVSPRGGPRARRRLPAGYAVSLLIGRLAGVDDARPPARWLALAPGTLTVTGFAAMGLRFGPSPVLPAYCYLAALSVTLAFTDARCRRLPDVLTLSSYPAAAALLGAAAAFVPGGPRLLARAMLGAALAAGFYLLLACVYPAGLGWGDVKLSGVLGMYLGWLGPRVFTAGLAGAFVLAAAVGAVLIWAGAATRHSRIAFGPFMVSAAAAVILASQLAGSGFP